MKKYIRTKDGVIYDTKELIKKFKKIENHEKMNYEEFQLANVIFNKKFDSNGWKRRFDKESDNLEELCDVFVVWLEGRNMPIEMPLSEKEQYEKMKEVVLLGTKGKLNIWLKLAIWTGKGLIYVAKMNEKGELELI